MDSKELTPNESLALITNVILEAKSRFRDNGFSFILLGICSFAASLGQFVLLKLEFYQINYFPYFIMPVAGAITFFYYQKKGRMVRSKNMISSLLGVLGAILGINLMVAGFFFWNKFDIALVPFILIILAIWLVITGVSIKNKVFFISGIAVNIMAFCTFYIAGENHPLILAIASLIGLVVPGLMLNFSQKENHV
ncbi:MAG: hypothetical protein JW830_12685 [Bacteroidales bacterium]|nr:hypothetical protein [Bacteroidales bacterium]